MASVSNSVKVDQSEDDCLAYGVEVDGVVYGLPNQPPLCTGMVRVIPHDPKL